MKIKRTGVSILIIDDEIPFVDAMTKRLRRRGYSVSTAHTGEDGLAVLEKNSDIEVVVLDVNMPGMGGVETLKIIRRIFPLVQILMLTGHRTAYDAIEGMRLGAFDYLMKIFDFNELVAKIEAARERRDAQVSRIIGAEIMQASIADG